MSAQKVNLAGGFLRIAVVVWLVVTSYYARDKWQSLSRSYEYGANLGAYIETKNPLFMGLQSTDAISREAYGLGVPAESLGHMTPGDSIALKVQSVRSGHDWRRPEPFDSTWAITSYEQTVLGATLRARYLARTNEVVFQQWKGWAGRALLFWLGGWTIAFLVVLWIARGFKIGGRTQETAARRSTNRSSD